MARLLFLTSNLQLPQTVYIWRWRAGLPKPVLAAGKPRMACDISPGQNYEPGGHSQRFLIFSFLLMVTLMREVVAIPSHLLSLCLTHWDSDSEKNFILNRLAGIIHWVSTDSAPCRKLLKLKDRRSAEFVGFYSSSCVVDYTAVIFSAHLRHAMRGFNSTSQ